MAMEVGGGRFCPLGKFPWKFVEVDLLPEVSGSFHGSIWKFPLTVEVEA